MLFFWDVFAIFALVDFLRKDDLVFMGLKSTFSLKKIVKFHTLLINLNSNKDEERHFEGDTLRHKSTRKIFTRFHNENYGTKMREILGKRNSYYIRRLVLSILNQLMAEHRSSSFELSKSHSIETRSQCTLFVT